MPADAPGLACSPPLTGFVHQPFDDVLRCDPPCTHSPLPSQEFVHQPFDDVLSYEQFSLRLRVSDMPQLMVGAPGAGRSHLPSDVGQWPGCGT